MQSCLTKILGLPSIKLPIRYSLADSHPTLGVSGLWGAFVKVIVMRMFLSAIRIGIRNVGRKRSQGERRYALIQITDTAKEN